MCVKWPALALASIVLLSSTEGGRAAPRLQAPEPIELRPASILYGEVPLANLGVDASGDVDGDGAIDMIFGWYPTQTRYAYQAAIAMGRPDWPASAGLSQLTQIHSLGFPSVDDWSPNAPVYYLQDVHDLSGDGLADLVVRKDEYRAFDRIAAEARIYYGHADWGPIDVRSKEPDLLIRQARAPWTPSEAGRLMMPDTVFAGDFNGDGRRDVAIGSCGVLPRRPDGIAIEDGPTPLQLFFGPDGGLHRIDLGTTKPSVEIETRAGQLGCKDGSRGIGGRHEDSAADLNGDGMADLVLGENGKAYFAFGRPTWPASATVSDVGDVVIDHRSTQGNGVSIRLIDDITGDGRKEVVGGYNDGATRRAMECVWFGGHVFAAKHDVADCDIRVTEEPIHMVGDVTGDGLRDIVFAWPPIGFTVTDWRIVAGPIAAGTQLAIGKRGTSGDYVIRIPDPGLQYGMPDWRFDDVTGDGRDDLVLHSVSQTSPTGVTRAGVVSIHVGPLVASAATPVVATLTATPTIEVLPSASPSATATPDEPVPTVPPEASATTAPTAVPATPTAGPVRATIFLPITYTGRPADWIPSDRAAGRAMTRSSNASAARRVATVCEWVPLAASPFDDREATRLLMQDLPERRGVLFYSFAVARPRRLVLLDLSAGPPGVWTELPSDGAPTGLAGSAWTAVRHSAGGPDELIVNEGRTSTMNPEVHRLTLRAGQESWSSVAVGGRMPMGYPMVLAWIAADDALVSFGGAVRAAASRVKPLPFLRLSLVSSPQWEELQSPAGGTTKDYLKAVSYDRMGQRMYFVVIDDPENRNVKNYDSLWSLDLAHGWANAKWDELPTSMNRPPIKLFNPQCVFSADHRWLLVFGWLPVNRPTLFALDLNKSPAEWTELSPAGQAPSGPEGVGMQAVYASAAGLTVIQELYVNDPTGRVTLTGLRCAGAAPSASPTPTVAPTAVPSTPAAATTVPSATASPTQPPATPPTATAERATPTTLAPPSPTTTPTPVPSATPPIAAPTKLYMPALHRGAEPPVSR